MFEEDQESVDDWPMVMTTGFAVRVHDGFAAVGIPNDCVLTEAIGSRTEATNRVTLFCEGTDSVYVSPLIGTPSANATIAPSVVFTK